MGDRIRNIYGSIWQTDYPGSRALYMRSATGAFYVHPNKHTMAKLTTEAGALGEDGVMFDVGRETPVGASVGPRSWGSLACAYFGQPAAA